MRLKLTILLLLLNIVLFGLIYYLEKGATAPEGPGPVFEPGVFENSTVLEIQGNGLAENWTLQKQVDGWRISSPVNWPANLFAVNRILNQLQFLEKEAWFDVSEIRKAGQSLADYGLEEPKAVISIGNEKKRTSIKIGEPTEIGSRLYILSPDETQVFVVTRDLLTSVSLSMEELRSQDVFNIPLFEVRSLRIGITNPGNVTVRLERENNSWKFVTPIQAVASKMNVDAAINSLAGIKIQDFRTPDLAQQGLDDRSLRMRITLEGNNRRQTLHVGNPVAGEANRYYAMMSDNPTVFTVAAEPLDNLLKAQETLRERKFFKFDRSRLSAIEISSGAQKANLQVLENGTWQVPVVDASGVLQPLSADSNVIKRLVDALLNLEAVAFISDAPAEADLESYGFNDPQRRVVINAGDSKTLLIGDLDSRTHRLYAKLEKEPFVYQVQPDILGLLQVRPLHYRLRLLIEQPPSASITSVTLDELETGNVLLSLEQENIEGQSPGSDASVAFAHVLDHLSEDVRLAALTLLDYVRRFDVKSYLKSGFSADGYQSGDKLVPWKYRLKADINLPGGGGQTRVVHFYFTERLGGTTQIGGTPESDVIFELNQPLIDALHTLTFDRPVPTLEDIAPPEAKTDVETPAEDLSEDGDQEPEASEPVAPNPENP